MTLLQVYRAEEREVERLTYRPGSFSSSTNSRDSESRPRYPIVELSVPKPSAHRSNSLELNSSEIPLIDYDSNLSSSWSRSTTPSTHQRGYCSHIEALKESVFRQHHKKLSKRRPTGRSRRKFVLNSTSYRQR